MANENDRPTTGARKRVAVIGAGAAGMVCAWGLAQRFVVTLYEASNSLGGTVRTIQVSHGGRDIPVETGFAQFVPAAFPRLTKLLELLAVDMRSSGASLTVVRTGARPFVWPPRRPSHMLEPKLLAEFVKTLRRAKPLIEARDWAPTLDHWATAAGLSTRFVDEVLRPFAGVSRALVPSVAAELAAYPLLAYLMMPGSLRPPSWRVIDGGAQRYIDALASRLGDVEVRTSTPVRALVPDERGGLQVVDGSGSAPFDIVVVATSAHAARELLAEHPDTRARAHALARLSFYPVVDVVHSDPRLMPERRADWSLANIGRLGDSLAYTSWAGHDFGRAPIFRGWTTGSPDEIRDVHDVHRWMHTMMTPTVGDVQRLIADEQGRGGVWLAGLYTVDIDSHESALRSASTVIEALAPDASVLTWLR
jgi:predicted NAD/FAD-binding protein